MRHARRPGEVRESKEPVWSPTRTSNSDGMQRKCSLRTRRVKRNSSMGVSEIYLTVDGSGILDLEFRQRKSIAWSSNRGVVVLIWGGRR